MKSIASKKLPRFKIKIHGQFAFTLIELLVVTTVIGLLAALLIPAFARTFHRVGAVSCLGTLRQWALATSLYSADSAGFLPWDGAPNGISRSRAWYVDLPPFLSIKPYHAEGAWRTNAQASLGHPLWFCPSNRRRSNGNLLFHYCLNRELNGNGRNTQQTRPDSVPTPSQTVWLFDNGRLAACAGRGNLHPQIHGNGANILFVDGSVRHFSTPRSAASNSTSPLIWNP